MADLKVIPTKTARFTQVVQRAGKPSVHLTFVAPEKDEALQKLLKQNRVMTVHRGGRSGGADFGLVGLRKEKGSQLWIFPKSLKSFLDRRIVGINYDLVEQDFSLGVDAKAEAKTKAFLAQENKRRSHEEKVRKAEKRTHAVAEESTHRSPKSHARRDSTAEKTVGKPSKQPAKKRKTESRSEPLELADIVIHLRSIQSHLRRKHYAQVSSGVEDLLEELEAQT